jgi:plastocyanin
MIIFMDQKKLLLGIVFSLIITIVVCGCTSNSETSTTTTTIHGVYSIEIRNFAFNPVQLTIPVGTMVTWTNYDSASHTVTPDNANTPNGFGSAQLGQGQTYSFNFTQPGDFAYHCGVHPSMKAKVIVQ